MAADHILGDGESALLTWAFSIPVARVGPGPKCLLNV